MDIYKQGNICVRTIEEKDRKEFLDLFNSEDFGCIAINEDMKPSLYEEDLILTEIINKEDIGNEILVIEDSSEFKGYIAVDRPQKYIYHIGHIAVKPNQRKKGYGKLLIDIVKFLANQDQCDITLECLKSGKFFYKMGFDGKSINLWHTYQENDSSVQLNSIPHRIFTDYSIIEEERQKILDAENEKSKKEYQKFLKSRLFDAIKNL